MFGNLKLKNLEKRGFSKVFIGGGRKINTLFLKENLIDELKEILDIDEMPDEDRAAYQTLSGFIMGQLGSIPKAGQYFEWERFRFEVVDMDGRRVDKVLVSLLNNKVDTQAET